MKLKSFLERLFGGQVIEKIKSPINGEILVLEGLKGKRFIRVGGITQSGGIVQGIWKRTLSVLKAQDLRLKTALILGLGGGTAAEILVEKWPGVKITGIEIDPKIIGVGKKYFNLDKIPNLKIIVGDAIKTITNQPSTINNRKYNLILVDLYQGQRFPKEAESEEFLNGLKRILAKDGLIVFNRLNFGKHKKETSNFLEKLKEFFPKVFFQKTESNLFIFCGLL